MSRTQQRRFPPACQPRPRKCVASGYETPTPDPDEVPVRATQFDLSRQASLGVTLRGLDDMLADLVAELRRRDMI